MFKLLAFTCMATLVSLFILIGTSVAQPDSLSSAIAPTLKAIPAPGSIAEFGDCNAFGPNGFGYMGGSTQVQALWVFETQNTWARDTAEACCAHHGMEFLRYAFIPVQYINGNYWAGGPGVIVACYVKDDHHQTQ